VRDRDLVVGLELTTREPLEDRSDASHPERRELGCA
jgi:hypothetical protein